MAQLKLDTPSKGLIWAVNHLSLKGAFTIVLMRDEHLLMHSYRLASQSTCSYISSAIDCVVSACAVNHGFWSLYIANASCEAFLRSSIAHGLLWARCMERDLWKFYANRSNLVNANPVSVAKCACVPCYIYCFWEGLGEKCATSHQLLYVCEWGTWRNASRTNWRYFASLVVDARTTELNFCEPVLRIAFAKQALRLTRHTTFSTWIRMIKAMDIYVQFWEVSLHYLPCGLELSTRTHYVQLTQSIAMLLHSDIAH